MRRHASSSEQNAIDAELTEAKKTVVTSLYSSVTVILQTIRKQKLATIRKAMAEYLAEIILPVNSDSGNTGRNEIPRLTSKSDPVPTLQSLSLNSFCRVPCHAFILIFISEHRTL